jgi:hypothetical protein
MVLVCIVLWNNELFLLTEVLEPDFIAHFESETNFFEMILMRMMVPNI